MCIGWRTAAMTWVVTCLSLSVSADDWPQWRGPQRDGVWRETGLVDNFAPGQLELLWKTVIGSGYSGPTVADKRVYVADRVVAGNDQLERVHCFDSRSGQAKWSYQYDSAYVNVNHDAGPRGSVTIHDRRAYSLGAMGHMFCFDADDGKVLWQKDLNAEYNIRMPTWGISCSPLIEGELVIIQIGGSDQACLVALDRMSGEPRWQALNDPASYSSPLVIEQAGKRVLVCWTGTRVVGLDPINGKLHWQYPLPPPKWIRSCASPVWSGHRLFISGFFTGAVMFELLQDKLEIDLLWHRMGTDEKNEDGLRTSIAEPVIWDNFIYGVDSNGELRCLDANTGERIWENLEVIPQQRWSTLRIVPNHERAWIFTELGELAMGQLSPNGYEEISRAQLIRPTKLQEPTRRKGVCWSYPAFADGCVFARNDEELVCASLEK